jgi:hypothetical protein
MKVAVAYGFHVCLHLSYADSDQISLPKIENIFLTGFLLDRTPVKKSPAQDPDEPHEIDCLEAAGHHQSAGQPYQQLARGAVLCEYSDSLTKINIMCQYTSTWHILLYYNSLDSIKTLYLVIS